MTGHELLSVWAAWIHEYGEIDAPPDTHDPDIPDDVPAAISRARAPGSGSPATHSDPVFWVAVRAMGRNATVSRVDRLLREYRAAGLECEVQAAYECYIGRPCEVEHAQSVHGIAMRRQFDGPCSLEQMARRMHLEPGCAHVFLRRIRKRVAKDVRKAERVARGKAGEVRRDAA